MKAYVAVRYQGPLLELLAQNQPTITLQFDSEPSDPYETREAAEQVCANLNNYRNWPKPLELTDPNGQPILPIPFFRVEESSRGYVIACELPLVKAAGVR